MAHWISRGISFDLRKRGAVRSVYDERYMFARIESVISRTELAALSERYKQVAGYDKLTLQGGKPQ